MSAPNDYKGAVTLYFYRLYPLFKMEKLHFHLTDPKILNKLLDLNIMSESIL